MSAEAAFAKALIDHLKSDGRVLDYLGPTGRIYDHAPAGASFPYLSLGEGETEPMDGSEVDLLDHRLSLHIFGRKDDRDGIKRALGAVRSALHQTRLVMQSPYSCTLCRVVYSDILTGPDLRTLHGILRVRGVVEIKKNIIL